MQPKMPSDDNWQTPPEQPSKTPYVAPVDDDTEQAETVVTMQPDEPEAEAATSLEKAVPVSNEPVHWQASEYIHQEKNIAWFITFGIVVVALMAVAIFLMDSITFAILVPVMAVALLVYIHRPPRLLDYTLSRQGLHINDHLYSFSEFKSFGVVHDGDEYSIMLIPVKRFHQGVAVYFPEEAGEAIVDMLGARIPMQELHLDLFDRIIRKLRI